MSEVYLSEEDESVLRQKALNNVLLALVTHVISTSTDPATALDDLKGTTESISLAGSHSDDPDTNDYARRLVASTAQIFLDQIKIDQGA